MINDVIKSYDKPTTVIAKVCWKSSQKAKFMAQLGNITNPKTVRFIREMTLTYSLDANDVLVIDAACPFIRQYFLQANNTNKFSKPHRWFIIEESLNHTDIVPHDIIDLNILLESEVIVTKKIDDQEYYLYVVYKIKPETEWLTEYFGTWTISKGLNKSKDMDVSIAMRRKNFSKERIVTSTVINDNTTDLNDIRYFHVDTVTKTGYRQISPLYDFINATQVILFTDTWGYLVNGTWSGMIKHLIEGEAELAGTVTLMTKERVQVLDYLTHPTPVDVRFIFREPPLSYTNNLFLLPFKTAVWYCIAAFVLILAFILHLNTTWEYKKCKNLCMDSNDPTALQPNLSDIAILIVSAMTQQGSSVELKGTLGRVVIFILFLTFLFLYTSYSASIVVLLQSSSNQIRTLSDLLNSRLELGVEDTPYNRHFFATAKDPIRKAIYETKIAPRGSKPNFLTLEDGVKKLQKKAFAFNMNFGTGYRFVEKYFHEHEKCGLQEINFLSFEPWFSCRKHSPYKEIFKIGLLRIQEHGLSDRANRLLFAKKPVCTVRGGSFGSVNIVDTYPVMMMLIFGIILAFFLLFIEILVHRLQALRFNFKNLVM